MAEIRKSLDENFFKGNNEDILVPTPSDDYEHNNEPNQNQNQNQLFNNIQEPLISNQIYPNPNEISGSYPSQNNIEVNPNHQNNYSIPPPLVNNINNQNVIPNHNNIQPSVEVNQNRNDNYQNNLMPYNSNNPYNYQNNYQNNYQQNYSPINAYNALQSQQNNRPCCGPLECVAVFVGLSCGFISIFILPYIFFS